MKLLISIIMIVISTLITAWGDSRGFLYGSNAWNKGVLDLTNGIKSVLGFAIGAVGFVIMVKYLNELKIKTPELTTLFWFVATIIFVAFGSRQLFSWPLIDKIVAFLVVIGLGFLSFRNGG